MASSYFGTSASGAAAAVANAGLNTITGTSVPQTATDSSVKNPDPTAYNYTPQNELGPQETPSAWGITNQNLTLYTGDPNVQSTLSPNAILAAIADHYGVQPSRKVSLLQQAEGALGAHLGIRNKQGTTILNQIVQKLGINPVTSGLSLSDNSGIWGAVASKLGIPVQQSRPGPDKTQNIIDSAKGIYNMNAQTLSALQDKMYQAGYYDSAVRPGTSNTYTPGHLDIYTMQAWGTLLTDTANAYNGGKGKKVTWNDQLNAQLSVMQQQGGIESILGKQPSPITVATQAQLQIPALDAFEARLGRGPTPAELAAFTQSFDTQQTAHAADITPGSTLFPDQNAVQQVPGVPTPTNAAAAFAMQASPKEYFGAQMANAGALMINALAKGKTLGSDPSLITATRPL